jgi:PTH2 family peptidyl-tRNA hydrolase
MKEAKQIIVMRTDLGMGRGKAGSQCSHASLATILKLGKKSYFFEQGGKPMNRITIDFEDDSALDCWLNVKFTKIVLAVETEEELIEVYNNAIKEGLNAVLITDAGLTEFNGVPTKTCVSIGPHFPEEIDKVTGHLKTFR